MEYKEIPTDIRQSFVWPQEKFINEYTYSLQQSKRRFAWTSSTVMETGNFSCVQGGKFEVVIQKSSSRFSFFFPNAIPDEKQGIIIFKCKMQILVNYNDWIIQWTRYVRARTYMPTHALLNEEINGKIWIIKNEILNERKKRNKQWIYRKLHQESTA